MAFDLQSFGQAMEQSVNPDAEAAAQSMVDDARHYVEAVSAAADACSMSAAEDIVSSSGMKLIARGARIDATLREKLAGHRISGGALERSLTITDGVSPVSLATDIAHRIDSDPWLARLATRSLDPGAMRHGAARLKLPPEALFRLTIAREQRPTLYRHSLGVAIISHYLALRLALTQKEIDSLLTAALYHDVGELHTDPAILEPGHRVTDEERRFIYVHPITSWLIVRDLPGLDPAIARAVLQHQERLDGSGYPYGLSGDAVGLGGRILGAADVSEAIMARFADHQRLSTLLRLNQNKYDRKVVAPLYEGMALEAPGKSGFQRERASARLAAFASLLDGWGRLRASIAGSHGTAVEFLSERMFNLRTVLLQFGFDPDSFDTLLGVADEDAAIAEELATVIDELQFQLTDLAREFDRRPPCALDRLDATAASALADWRLLLDACLSD